MNQEQKRKEVDDDFFEGYDLSGKNLLKVRNIFLQFKETW